MIAKNGASLARWGREWGRSLYRIRCTVFIARFSGRIHTAEGIGYASGVQCVTAHKTARHSAKNVTESGVAQRETLLVERQSLRSCLAEERWGGGVRVGLGPAGIDVHGKPSQPK